MDLNLKKLTIAQLEKLIADAGKERANRTDKSVEEPTWEQVEVTGNPTWRAQPVNGTLIVRFLSGFYGWDNFAFSKAEVAELMTYLLKVVTGGYIDGGKDINDIAAASGSSTKH